MLLGIVLSKILEVARLITPPPIAPIIAPGIAPIPAGAPA